jgi:hypothetical protein
VFRFVIGGESFLDLRVSGGMQCKARGESAAGNGAASKVAACTTATGHIGKSFRTPPRVKGPRRLWQFFVVNVPSLFENNTDWRPTLSASQESCDRFTAGIIRSCARDS